jgi:hypothetical protein
MLFCVWDSSSSMSESAGCKAVNFFGWEVPNVGLKGQRKSIQRLSLMKQKGDTAVGLPVKVRKIIMATNRELSNEHYYRRLWLMLRNLVGKGRLFSRREWVEFCIAYFRDMNGKVEFWWKSGIPYVPPDWDILFPDADCRWLSDYLQECKGEPKSHSPLYGRLRVFDAVIQARWPHIAKRIRA